ncbi:MAG: DUF4338 domain-containing protein [Gammaproteobacteria bacterium]|nr:DUF4338 domain-containing protein [Gammaproteobacteria bacterium]
MSESRLPPARELPEQWYQRYRIRPVLLEAFVDNRFSGTCCRAASWINSFISFRFSPIGKTLSERNSC